MSSITSSVELEGGARPPPLNHVRNDFGYTVELPLIVLSRVVVRLGRLDMINTKVIEDLFSADFAHLQDLYNRINQVDVDENPV